MLKSYQLTASGQVPLEIEKPRRLTPAGLFVVFKRCCLQGLYVAGLGALGTVRDLEGHSLALFQSLETVADNGREVYKDVCASIRRRNEAKTF